MKTARTLIAIGLLSLLTVTACSSTTSGGLSPGTTGGTDTSTATTDTSTASTDEATTTTVPVDPLLLRSDGLGPHDFGVDGATVIDAVTTLLGAPISDENQSFPVVDGVAFNTEDGGMQFVAPLSRTVCWSDGLCLTFGGADAASMSFTGWQYRDDPAATLHSESGATMEASWADLPGLTVNDGGCYSEGYGAVDGIFVSLRSDGVPFTEIDGSGNFITNVPAPTDVFITDMEAGDLPVFLYGDC